MTTTLKRVKSLHLLLIGMMLLQFIPACTKRSALPETAPIPKVLPDPEVDPEVPTPQKVLLPLQLLSSVTTVKLKYLEGKPLLAELNGPEGLQLKISYSNSGHPEGMVSYKNAKLNGFIIYLKEPDGQIYKIERSMYSNKGATVTSAGFTLLDYNEQHQIIRTKDYDKDNLLVSERNWLYTKDNLSSITVKGNSNYQFNYTYDSKNGIFKHIPYADLLFLETAGSDLWPGINNLKGQLSTQMPASDKKITYQYNTEGYPIEMAIKKGTETETLKVTYKTMSP